MMATRGPGSLIAGVLDIEWRGLRARREPLDRLSCCRREPSTPHSGGHTGRDEVEDKDMLSRLLCWLVVKQVLMFVQALPRGPGTNGPPAWVLGPGPHPASAPAGMKPAVVTSGCWRRGRQAARL